MPVWVQFNDHSDGNTLKWYKGYITDRPEKSDLYEIEFQDGERKEIRRSNIRHKEPPENEPHFTNKKLPRRCCTHIGAANPAELGNRRSKQQPVSTPTYEETIEERKRKGLPVWMEFNDGVTDEKKWYEGTILSGQGSSYAIGFVDGEVETDVRSDEIRCKKPRHRLAAMATAKAATGATAKTAPEAAQQRKRGAIPEYLPDGEDSSKYADRGCGKWWAFEEEKEEAALPQKRKRAPVVRWVDEASKEVISARSPAVSPASTRKRSAKLGQSHQRCVSPQQELPIPSVTKMAKELERSASNASRSKRLVNVKKSGNKRVVECKEMREQQSSHHENPASVHSGHQNVEFGHAPHTQSHNLKGYIISGSHTSKAYREMAARIEKHKVKFWDEKKRSMAPDRFKAVSNPERLQRSELRGRRARISSTENTLPPTELKFSEWHTFSSTSEAADFIGVDGPKTSTAITHKQLLRGRGEEEGYQWQLESVFQGDRRISSGTRRKRSTRVFDDCDIDAGAESPDISPIAAEPTKEQYVSMLQHTQPANAEWAETTKDFITGCDLDPVLEGVRKWVNGSEEQQEKLRKKQAQVRPDPITDPQVLDSCLDANGHCLFTGIHPMAHHLDYSHWDHIANHRTHQSADNTTVSPVSTACVDPSENCTAGISLLELSSANKPCVRLQKLNTFCETKLQASASPLPPILRQLEQAGQIPPAMLLLLRCYPPDTRIKVRAEGQTQLKSLQWVTTHWLQSGNLSESMSSKPSTSPGSGSRIQRSSSRSMDNHESMRFNVTDFKIRGGAYHKQLDIGYMEKLNVLSQHSALQLSLEVCSAVLSPKGAITGNHTDVFHSVNHGFCGKKLWFWWDFAEAETKRLLNRTRRRQEKAQASKAGVHVATTSDEDEDNDDRGGLMNPAYHGEETFDFEEFMQLESSRWAIVDGDRNHSLALLSHYAHRVVTVKPYLGCGYFFTSKGTAEKSFKWIVGYGKRVHGPELLPSALEQLQSMESVKQAWNKEFPKYKRADHVQVEIHDDDTFYITDTDEEDAGEAVDNAHPQSPVLLKDKQTKPALDSAAKGVDKATHSGINEPDPSQEQAVPQLPLPRKELDGKQVSEDSHSEQTKLETDVNKWISDYRREREAKMKPDRLKASRNSSSRFSVFARQVGTKKWFEFSSQHEAAQFMAVPDSHLMCARKSNRSLQHSHWKTDWQFKTSGQGDCAPCGRMVAGSEHRRRRERKPRSTPRKKRKRKELDVHETDCGYRWYDTEVTDLDNNGFRLSVKGYPRQYWYKLRRNPLTLNVDNGENGEDGALNLESASAGKRTYANIPV